MPRLTKRRFLQLAGLSISNRVAGQVRPAPAARPASKVILVTFGGGVRYSETFAPDGLRNIPRLVAMRPHGYFFASCINSGVLSHFNSTASIVTGNWQRVDDFGFQPPAGATLFEQFRKQTGAGPLDAWTVATNKSFALMGAGSDRMLGQPYGANVVLPKQLLLEAVQDVVRKGTAGGVADRDAVLQRLEGILSEGYEGIGWTIFQAGRKLDQHVRETLIRGLADYINGPEAPTSGDELTFFIAREIMREFAPRLLLVNFWDMDVAHWGSYSLYLNAITKTDRLTGMLWDEVEANPAYRGRTTMLVLPELGRDGDRNAANGFLNHRSGDPSCRNMWMLAMGAGVPGGATDRPVHHIDVAATAAEILGVHLHGAAGQPLRELQL
ncbi:MAG TPA: hypothetical protein VKX45_10070 [Bryobacteraceae bacterium]|jgi:hypothetical protein|nr:hypothetical protein [Bryobacteraceae bacterium]